MHINHLSISRESIFNTCEQKYKYRYHLNVPVEVEQPYFKYGKLIHRIIEIYTKNRGKVHIADITKQVLSTEDPLPFYYGKQIHDDLQQFMILTKKIGTDGDVELNFSRDLEPGKNKCVVGLIDRLIEKNGTYHIIDFKTTKRGQYQKTLENIVEDYQLQCYAWIISSSLNVPAEKIKVALYYLQGGTLVATQYSTQVLDETPKRLLKVYNKIMNMDPDSVVGKVGEHCLLCEYCKICPFFKALKI